MEVLSVLLLSVLEDAILLQVISINVDIIIRPELIEPTGSNFRFIFPFVITVICIVNLALNLGLRVNKL